jgi:hypothetical protein
MKTFTVYSVLVVLMSSFFSGCAQQAKMGLKFQKGQKSVYRVVEHSGKDYYFEQSSEDKVTDKSTGRYLEMVLEQKTADVGDDGSALIDVTVKQLKFKSESAKGVNEVFDSTNPAKDSGELASVIGKSYRIKLKQNGQAEVIDNTEIKKAAKGQTASWIFNKENIAGRHTIKAIPAKDTVNVGQSWSEIVAGPKGMLQSKNYEKIYTLKEIHNQNTAVIKMKAIPTTENPEDAQDGSGKNAMGFFGNMFDSSDTYEGQAVIDLQTGQVKKYHEKLDARWVATDDSKNTGKPDVLKMGFIDSFSMELLGN